MRFHLLLAVLSFLLLTPLHSAAQDERRPETPLPTGTWRAWLTLDGGNILCFQIEVQESADGEYRSFLLNADERIEVKTTSWLLDDKNAPTLRLGFPHYDSVIRAKLRANGRTFVGHWVKRQGTGEPRRVPFVATVGEEERFPSVLNPGSFKSVTGRWRMKFEDQEDDAVMLLRQKEQGSYLEGTILTTTGDYRYLEGRIDRGHLQLSTFDGAHAFLIRGHVDPDRSLSGSFHSGNWYETSWTATRDADVSLADPLDETSWIAGSHIADLAYPRLSGDVQSLVSEEWAGRPLILNLFGSWCPNCHDEAELLNEIFAEHEERGLAVLGLAFELPGDFARSKMQVARFRVRHGTAYPTMIAGNTPKPASTRALGTVDRLRSYPTSIFVRRDGSIAGVHTGFVGPAAAAEHLSERARFEELVAEILASEPFDADAARASFNQGSWSGPGGALVADENTLFVPGGLWSKERLIRLDSVHGVAWDANDPDRFFLSGAKLTVSDFGSPNLTRRRAALFALVAHRGDKPLPEAIALLTDPSPLVQTIAAWAVGRTGTKAALDSLTPLGNDAHAPLAREVERALRRL